VKRKEVVEEEEVGKEEAEEEVDVVRRGELRLAERSLGSSRLDLV
jgi:hypothetical protein